MSGVRGVQLEVFFPISGREDSIAAIGLGHSRLPLQT